MPGLRLGDELRLHRASVATPHDWVALAAQLGGGLGAYTVPWRLELMTCSSKRWRNFNDLGASTALDFHNLFFLEAYGQT